MTDLISCLADDLIQLINASPRSPSKEQIVDLIRDRVMRWDPIANVMRTEPPPEHPYPYPEPVNEVNDCQGESVFPAVYKDDLVHAVGMIPVSGWKVMQLSKAALELCRQSHKDMPSFTGVIAIASGEGCCNVLGDYHHWVPGGVSITPAGETRDAAMCSACGMLKP